MRRSMLSVPGAGPAQPQSAGSAGQAEVRRSFLDWLPASVWPLFEILRGRQPDGEEQVGLTVIHLAFMASQLIQLQGRLCSTVCFMHAYPLGHA